MFSSDTSGDMIADRRFTLAMQLYERGDAEAALDLLEQAEEIAPAWPPLPFRRGEILMALEKYEDARAAFTACLRLDPQDRMGATVKLTLLGAMPQPDTLPAPYVEALFDDYAPRFDSALLENLSYQAPQLLSRIVEKHRPREDGVTAEYILDLGCGTGLSGENFIKRAAWLEGIDLSAGMLERAAAKGIYNKLEQGDLLAVLQQPGATPCDLAVAADVFVYMGELGPLFELVSARLRPGALFAFTTQKLKDAAGQPYRLCADHRYAHSAAYIDNCLARAGLVLLEKEEHILRQDRGAGIEGYVILAGKPLSLDIDIPGAAVIPARRRPRGSA